MGGFRGDRWKDLSLSQFLAAVEAVLLVRVEHAAPGLGTQGSWKHGGLRRLGATGTPPSGGSLILREAEGAQDPVSTRLRPSRSPLASTEMPTSGRLRFGGGGGSRGLGPLEVKEWARGMSEKAGFRAVGTGGGG